MINVRSILCYLIMALNVEGQNILQTFDNSTLSVLNGTWVVPLNVSQIKVQCWGAGGAGGGASGQAAAGGGGSGGAYTEKIIQVSAGQSFNYSIGSGGVGSNSTGGVGGNTWFGASTSLLAKGGNGGGGMANSFATAAGAAAVVSGNVGGTVNYYGGSGGTGTYGANGSEAGGGGGGGGGGSLGTGFSGSGSQGGNGGNGGGGNGAWSAGVGCNCNGSNGSIPGGGGSGGQASGVADRFGGQGGGGRISISYTIPGIGGRIFSDQNQNCIDNSEPGISGIRVMLQPGDLITETDSLGNYNFNFIPAGQYTVFVDTSWSNLTYCTSFVSVNYAGGNVYSLIPSIGITNAQCNYPNISIFAPFLRRCFPNQLVYVSACNSNLAPSTIINSYADITLSQYLTVQNSSVPFTIIGNNKYRFQLGNLTPGQCVNFTISTSVSCSASNGLTLCMQAELFPVDSCVFDTIPNPPSPDNPVLPNGSAFQPCSTPWDQSSLSVDGYCQNDTVCFTITNTGQPGGGDMECYSPVRVYVDGVLTYFDSIMIAGGQTVSYCYPGNGQTWILQADQHPLHPGNSHPNAHVEACGDTSNWTPGGVNTFPLDDLRYRDQHLYL